MGKSAKKRSLKRPNDEAAGAVTEPVYSRWLVLALCVILIALTSGVFVRTLGNDFVNYDDNDYLTDNLIVKRGLTAENVAWVFTAGYASNWHPLTWLSHMADVSVWGMKPMGHHLTNIILHTVNVALLFILLVRLTGCPWRGGFVAALFAVHPQRAESVAWVAERKDVLSAMFWMLTTHAYVSYARRKSVGRYALVFVLYALGLMAKPMLVSLPITLLLLDIWPLGRKDGLRGLVWEKLPLFMLMMVSCVITFIVQHNSGATRHLEDISLSMRFYNAAVAYFAYIGKMIYPAKLAVFYPHPKSSLPVWQAAVSALGLILITVFAIKQRRSRPYLMVGWLWYLFTLVPVIGVVQVGAQAMADRYTYITMIGIYVITVWGAYEFASRKTALAVVGIVVITALAITTWRQTGHWKNGITLFEHAIAVTERNYVAYNAIGAELYNQKKYVEAEEYTAKAIEINSADPGSYENMGNIMLAQGRVDEALEAYETALQYGKEKSDLLSNIGVALSNKEKYEEAIEYFDKVLDKEPNHLSATFNKGAALARMRRYEEALPYFEKTLELDPNDIDGLYNLAAVYAQQGRNDKALDLLDKLLSIDPNNEAALYAKQFIMKNVSK